MVSANSSYLKLVVNVFVAFTAFIAAITTAFFGAAGLFYGEGVYENSILQQQDKYLCLTNCGTSSATYNTSINITSYTNYGLVRDSINSKVQLFLTATTIVFSLLTLVFLFIALRETGLFTSMKGNKGSHELY